MDLRCTSCPQGKLVLDGGDQDALSNTSIEFINGLTRVTWPFQTKLNLHKYLVKSDEYDDIIGLACIGGGMTLWRMIIDEKLGLINITPRGLDIKVSLARNVLAID